MNGSQMRNTSNDMFSLFPISLFDDETDSLTEKRILTIKRGDPGSYVYRTNIEDSIVLLPDTCFILTARRLYPKFWPEQEGQNLEIEIEILADQIRSLAFCIGFIGMFGLMLLSMLG